MLAHRRDAAGDQRGIGEAGRSGPPGRSRRRPGRRCGPRTRCRARPAGWAAAKSASAGREMGDAEGERRGQPDRPGDLGHRLGDHLLRRLELGEDVGGAGIIGLADVGRLGAARGAGQQPRAELLLEPGDAAGEDRLGQPHPLGGAGEGAGLRPPGRRRGRRRGRCDERSIFRNTMMLVDASSGNAASAPTSPQAIQSQGEKT